MHAADESFERLRAAISELALDDAPELLAEARAEARERVRSILSEALAHSMLESVREQIELPDEQPAPTEALAWYLYGVAGSDELSSAPPVVGVDPAYPLSTVREGSVAAIVSNVVIDDFGESELRAHLADMEWVERTARAHEHVLDEIGRRATVIPMRMCSVYRTEGGVREMLKREAGALERTLSELQGKREWAVKVFATGSRAARSDGEGERSDPDGDGDGAGAAYMERRRRDLERADRAGQLIEEAAAQIHERLCAVATDGLIAPSQRREASGHAGEMVLNGVYLVADASYDAFEEKLRTLEAEVEDLGVELELTGPWPAYNFVSATIGAAW
jgi:hypothetical protein